MENRLAIIRLLLTLFPQEANFSTFKLNFSSKIRTFKTLPVNFFQKFGS